MRRPLPPIILSLLAISVLFSTASAQQVGDSPIHVFLIGGPVEIHLGEEVEFTYAVYNNGTSTHLVEARVVELPEGFSARLEPSHVFLEAGRSDQFVLSLLAPVGGQEGVVLTTLEFQALDLTSAQVNILQVSRPTLFLGIAAEEDPVGKLFGVWSVPFPPPLDTVYTAFVITVALWILIASTVVYLAGPVARRFAEKKQRRIVNTILKILRGPVFIFIFAYGAVTSIQILGLPAESISFLLQVYSFILVLVATWIAYRIFRDVIIVYGMRRARGSRRDIRKRLLPSLDKVGGLLIVVVGILLAVQNLGFNVTLLLAGLGVLGLIIAFAAQDTLSNLFSGFHIMLDRPFQVGDLIEVEPGVICEVLDIGLRSTKLYYRRDHNLLIIPNNDIANKKVVNYLRPDFRYRMHVTLGVAYGSDLVKVEEVLKEVALAHPDVLKDPEHSAEVWVDEFGDSSINCRLIFWIQDARNHWRVRSDINKVIDRRFKEEGIRIPFPQRDVWMKATPSEQPPSTSKK